MVTNITLKTNHLASFLILLFFILTPLGIYTHTQNYIIGIYIFLLACYFYYLVKIIMNIYIIIL